ncbi:hypothetical protein [Neotamlana nanhaiensis]|nr:hypothetical protein [Tamlana nanhaiensis]
MKAIINLSRKLNKLTQHQEFTNNRSINFYFNNNGVWKGSKRYAH